MQDKNGSSLTRRGGVALIAGLLMEVALIAVSLEQLDTLRLFLAFLLPPFAIALMIAPFRRFLLWSILVLAASALLASIVLFHPASQLLGVRAHFVTGYSLEAILPPGSDTFNVKQKMAGTLRWEEEGSSQEISEAKARWILAKRLFRGGEKSWWHLDKVNIVDSSTDIDRKYDVRRYTIDFLASADTIKTAVESKSVVLNHAEFVLPENVGFGRAMGAPFSASILFPENTLTRWSEGDVRPSLFANGAPAQELTIKSDAAKYRIDVSYLKSGYRSCLTQAFLSWSFLDVIIYALAAVGSALLFCLAIARDLIVDQRLKPRVEQVLLKVGILKPKTAPAQI